MVSPSGRSRDADDRAADAGLVRRGGDDRRGRFRESEVPAHLRKIQKQVQREKTPQAQS